MCRSKDPVGLAQEVWALLALYQVLRVAVADAIATVPGLDPDRASWQVAVTTAQDLVTCAGNITDQDGDMVGDIGGAVLAALHPTRRARVCPRRVKSPLSRWNKHPPDRPTTTKKIATITIQHNSETTRPHRSLTTTSDP